MSIFDKIFDPVAAENAANEPKKKESPAEYDPFNSDIWATRLKGEFEEAKKIAALQQAHAAAKLRQMGTLQGAQFYSQGSVEPYPLIHFPDEQSREEVMDFMSLVKQAGLSVKEVNKMLVQSIREKGDGEDEHE